MNKIQFSGQVSITDAIRSKEVLQDEILRLSRNPLLSMMTKHSLTNQTILLGAPSFYEDISNDIPGSSERFLRLISDTEELIAHARVAIGRSVSKLPTFKN